MADIEELVTQIHQRSGKVVLAVTGGGSRAIAELLEVPGASRTLLEAIVPYAAQALVDWLGAPPEQFCAPRTARAMAMAAFERARALADAGEQAATGDLAGLSCTASLASDRTKRGAHRVHAALQTLEKTSTRSLELARGRRSRREEEEIAARIVLNLAAEAAGIPERLALPLVEGEEVEHLDTLAPPQWQGLLAGKYQAVSGQETLPAAGRGDSVAETGSSTAGEPSMQPGTARVIFPGAFNPLHEGHRRMAAVAAERLGKAVEYELSIENVDKPPLDYTEMDERQQQFAGGKLWLTRAPTFVEKSALFPAATFVVGIDTLVRIADPRYYGHDAAACLGALEAIAARGCRFLAFGRRQGEKFLTLSDVELPETLRRLCDEVPEREFRADVSSSALRGVGGEW